MRKKTRHISFFQNQPTLAFLLVSGLLVAVLYGRVLAAPFLYDDLDQIVHNPNLDTWSHFFERFALRPVNLSTSYLGYGGSTYRPLFWLSLFVDHALWGMNAGGYHATNLVLHLLVGNLAFALLREVKVPGGLAAAVCLLWLSLPIDAEAVAWVSGRSYPLCSVFVLTSLFAATRYVRGGGTRWGVACCAAAGCAVLSHELGVVVLPLLLLVPGLATDRSAKRRRYAVLGIAGLALAGVELLRFEIGVRTFTGVASPAWACRALCQYVVLSLVPWHMSVDRSTSIVVGEPHRWLPVAMLCVALAFGYAVYRRRAHPGLLAGLTWFAIGIAPFCLLRNYQGVAERFVYLASLGMVAAIVAVAGAPRQPRSRSVLMGAVAVWAVWNVSRTIVRAADWTDPVRLYRSSLLATPRSPSLRYNLAFSLRQRGDLAEAKTAYEEVLALDPRYPNGYASLGDVQLQLGSLAAAQASYRKALAQNPSDAVVLLNSGVAHQRAGEAPEAEASFQQVLAIDPANSAGHVNLGVLYMSQRRLNDAMHQFAIAIDQKTSDPVPYYDLAVIFQQAGRDDLAVVLYKKVLELRPNDEDTLANMRSMGRAH